MTVIRHCDLREIRGTLGWRAVARLFTSGGEGEGDYSLKPFVRTNSIFVHLPKTGGVSVNRALYGSLGMGHLTLREYRTLFRPRAFAGMFRFTFVRNPFDRIHSAYHFLRAGGMGEIDVEFAQRVLEKYPSFERFILEGLENEEVAGFWHFLPQTHFLGSEKDFHQDLDFVGRFETFEQDFDYVKARVNPSARLPHINRTPRKPRDYRRAYTPEMVDRLARHYAPVLALLGYEFDGAKRSAKVAKGVAAAR